MFGFFKRLFTALHISRKAKTGRKRKAHGSAMEILGDDFIKRIHSSDTEFIIKIGVPVIEPPPLPEPSTYKLPFVAEGIETTSLLLVDPEALMHLLLASQVSDVLAVKGSGLKILEEAAKNSKANPGVTYYMEGVPSYGTEIKVLASNGLVTGVYLVSGEANFSGSKALDILQSTY